MQIFQDEIQQKNKDQSNENLEEDDMNYSLYNNEQKSDRKKYQKLLKSINKRIENQSNVNSYIEVKSLLEQVSKEELSRKMELYNNFKQKKKLKEEQDKIEMEQQLLECQGYDQFLFKEQMMVNEQYSKSNYEEIIKQLDQVNINQNNLEQIMQKGLKGEQLDFYDKIDEDIKKGNLITDKIDDVVFDAKLDKILFNGAYIDFDEFDDIKFPVANQDISDEQISESSKDSDNGGFLTEVVRQKVDSKVLSSPHFIKALGRQSKIKSQELIDVNDLKELMVDSFKKASFIGDQEQMQKEIDKMILSNSSIKQFQDNMRKSDQISEIQENQKEFQLNKENKTFYRKFRKVKYLTNDSSIQVQTENNYYYRINSKRNSNMIYGSQMRNNFNTVMKTQPSSNTINKSEALRDLRVIKKREI
ncbi:hypothetical protein PPERSA_10905 [Pseudocohnilembus persalinus]|uniref:Uncharacterized protein n=1 Tax=Pseudocohnilembus persalinus TaxID=266149 RepID=A0A0V0R9K6_PSEPJ|nr:hypothetical protein PPERSA_10905 [Pseudocohnilembus persalinus]|eukprot:KRX11138.1 hypothetical protein PPERSA_10905 [Pseudocohnilembus persalinus]